MKAKILLENGLQEEFQIADKDVAMLTEAANHSTRLTGDKNNAVTEIAYGIIPWGIDMVRNREKGVIIGNSNIEVSEDDIKRGAVPLLDPEA